MNPMELSILSPTQEVHTVCPKQSWLLEENVQVPEQGATCCINELSHNLAYFPSGTLNAAS